MKSIYPTLDIHGETEASIVALINEFIKDNIKLKNNYVEIIHGKGSGILKNKTHELLRSNKLVISYKLDNWNIGITKVVLVNEFNPLTRRKL